MRGRARKVTLAAGVLSLLWLMAGGAWAQSPTATQRDCADFDTQEAAQAFYDQNKTTNPTDPDPYDLDTDGDGKACEGLPSSTSPAPVATAVPGATTAPGSTLPNNGAETGVLALAGLTFLEAGYGLTLASKRLGVRRRAIPLYLLRKFTSAARHGHDRVEVGEDMYLVHRSVLDQKSIELPTEDVSDYETNGHRAQTPGPNVYAALAKHESVTSNDEF